jgi:LysM repeat protein
LAAALAAGGCGGVSEDEMAKLQAENIALAAELESERRESDLLNRSLSAAYVERDRLVELLEAPPPPPEPAAGDEPPPEPKFYVVRSGDTLGEIAKRNNTTTTALVALNPFLRARRDLMVMENERITLPN